MIEKKQCCYQESDCSANFMNKKSKYAFPDRQYSVDSIKRTVHLTFHGLFFLLKILFFWKIENSTFNRDSTKFICLENFQYLLQYVFEFKKFVLNLHIYIGTYLHCVAKVYAVLPFYDVKCLCSGGREWGREESHSH